MITLDPYYSIDMYNHFLTALDNNGVNCDIYCLAKPPFHFYLDIPNPLLVNYDELPDNLRKYLVNITKPATPNDTYLLQRRFIDDSIKTYNKYATNLPLLEAENSKYACFFMVRNREHALQLSNEIGKIYYFGFYYKKYKICLTTNENIKLQNSNLILVEKETNTIQMELDLNFKIFKLNDRLKKYTQTPYILNGRYYPTQIQQFNHLV